MNKINNFLRILALLAVSLIWAHLGHTDDWKDVGEIVKADALKALQSMKDKASPLDQGRFYLLKEMLRAPQQLGRDYEGVPTLTMKVITGPKELKDETVYFPQKKTSISVQELNDSIRKLLIEKIGASDPTMIQRKEEGGTDTRLGKFWVSELIYPMTQNFNAQAAEIAIRDIPGMDPLKEEFKYGPKAGESSMKAALVYDPQSHVFTLSLISEKPYISLENEREPEVVLTTIGTAIFDLATGKVSYKFSYAFGDKRKEWTTDMPLLPQPERAPMKHK